MIYFVGAGPGDPEMISLKGYRLLQEADLVIYAGSLVNPAILEYAGEKARVVNSATLDLEEIVDAMEKAYRRDELVVRLHTGDAGIYGAIGEQMEELDGRRIPYQVIPGISSFLAAAASLKKEYTVPSGAQTVIVTRMEGRTPVPESENLRSLASHGASMAIFLSVGMVEKVQEELLREYPPDTPVAVLYRVSWPDELILRGKLNSLAEMTMEAGISKTALILVGDFLEKSGKSLLYDRTFSHGCREGRDEG